MIANFIRRADLQRLNDTIQQLQHMNQRLRALIEIFSEYSSLDSTSESVLYHILKWVKVQVLRDLYSHCISSKEDGINLAEVGIVCGENYIIEKYAEPINASFVKC